MAKDITVIVPLHEYNKDVEKLLTKALTSVPAEVGVILSCYGEIASDVSKKHKETIVTSDSKNFQTLVNAAVEKVETKWFSILEFDDVYSEIFLSNFEKYTNFNPEVSVFMPLTDLYDYSENKFIGYGNEAAWASSFSNEVGYVDNDCLQNFFDFYVTGSIFNTEDWKTYGGLKDNIKLTFWYEFLLRLTQSGKKVYVIPRVMYVHNLNREGSLIKQYSETVSEKESEYWIDIAKQEQFFTKNRNKEYSFEK